VSPLDWHSTALVPSQYAPSPDTANYYSARNVKSSWSFKTIPKDLDYSKTQSNLLMSMPQYNFYTNTSMEDVKYWNLMINVKNPADTVFSTKLTSELSKALPSGKVVNN
jgi:hypothetical protein